MIRPIIGYGHPTLKKVAADIDKDYPEVQQLIADMYETMYAAHGVGLAAPQIDLSIRIIVIDASPFEEDYPEAKDFKKTFINLHIEEENGEPWFFNEGCLSVPDVREDVSRKPEITVSYYDENFNFHENEVFTGLQARVMQHEHDHLEGKIFTDRLSQLKKMMIKRKLNDITHGNVSADYKMKFAVTKR